MGGGERGEATLRTGVALGLGAAAVEEHVGGGRVHGLGRDRADVRVVEAVPGAVVGLAERGVMPAAQAAKVVAHRKQIVHRGHILVPSTAHIQSQSGIEAIQLDVHGTSSAAEVSWYLGFDCDPNQAAQLDPELALVLQQLSGSS